MFKSLHKVSLRVHVVFICQNTVVNKNLFTIFLLLLLSLFIAIVIIFIVLCMMVNSPLLDL